MLIHRLCSKEDAAKPHDDDFTLCHFLSPPLLYSVFPGLLLLGVLVNDAVESSLNCRHRRWCWWRMNRVGVGVVYTSPPCFFFLLASSLNKRHRASLLGLVDLRGLIGVV
jgi:hypothetical protein